MKKIVFMLQNGIGFGHFKLALNIAEYLKSNHEIIFITQAKSTKIFDEYDYKVYNFPMLYTLKTNNEVLIMNKLLNNLIDSIKPDLVIEDTYPDDFYLNLPSLINVKKALILNRLDGAEFEHYYFSGIANQYQKIIVLKEKQDFMNELNSKEVINFANYSNRLVYYNGVFSQPNSNIKKHIIEKYNIDKYDKNIVVSCGAGGWHIGENVCETIFKEAICAVNSLSKNGLNVQLILILGPYSNYLKSKLAMKKNIKIVDFETNLDALFQVADLNVLRPGYNSTMEAISGGSNVLLLPGISYMEDQKDWCQELAKIYGIDYLEVENISQLEKKIKKLLEKNYRTQTQPRNYTKTVANEIENIVNTIAKDSCVQIAIKTHDNKCSTIIKKMLDDNNISLLKLKGDTFFIGNIPVLNMSNNELNIINKYHNYVIHNDEDICFNRLSYYTTRYNIDKQGSTIIQYEGIVYKNIDELIGKINTIMCNPQKFSNNILVSLPTIDKNDFVLVIDRVTKYCKNNNIQIKSFDDLLVEQVNNQTLEYKYEYYKPEITKLS